MTKDEAHKKFCEALTEINNAGYDIILTESAFESILNDGATPLSKLEYTLEDTFEVILK